MNAAPLPKVILRPYPNPEYLPKGVAVWLWEAWTYTGSARRVATGTVERRAGVAVSHAVQVIPEMQARGVYSALVLPELARMFGRIVSGPAQSDHARRAWLRAGARQLIAGRLYELGHRYYLTARMVSHT